MEIHYQSANSFFTFKKGTYLYHLSFGKRSLGFIALSILIWSFYIAYIGASLTTNVFWIIKWGLLMFIGDYLLTSFVYLPLYFKWYSYQIRKKKVSLFQSVYFTQNCINHLLINRRILLKYNDVREIVFCSDLIMLFKKSKGILYYDRNSFTNATEEEWIAFMKEHNPKIKVKYLKNDYIHF